MCVCVCGLTSLTSDGNFDVTHTSSVFCFLIMINDSAFFS